jgi:hypothetical protein
MTRILGALVALLLLPALAVADAPPPASGDVFRAILVNANTAYDWYCTPWSNVWSNPSAADTNYVFGYLNADLYRAPAPNADGTGGNGLTFTKIFDGGFASQTARGLFAGQRAVYVGQPLRDELHIFTDIKAATATRDSALDYESNDAANPVLWRGCMDDSFYCYVGEYTTAMNSGSNGNVWRTADNGATWLKRWNAAGEDTTHIHWVKYDPFTGCLYAAQGDSHHVTSAPRLAKLVRSCDHGATWDTLSQGLMMSQPTDFVGVDGRRLFGTDAGKQGVFGFEGALETPGDPVTWFLNLGTGTAGTGVRGGVWSMAADGDFVIAGTTQATATPNDSMGIYVSWQGGAAGSWKRAENWGNLTNNYDGVDWISPPTAQANPYFYVVKLDNAVRDVYRYQRKRDWTIGPAGDYATAALALADTLNVGAGDTLTFAAGTHNLGILAVGLKTNMTWRGASGNAANTILEARQAATAPCFAPTDATDNGWTFRDLTFRRLTAGAYTVTTAALVATGDVVDIDITFDGCAFRNINAAAGGAQPIMTWDGAAGSVVTFNECDFDSCSSASTGTATYGLVKLTDTALTFTGNMVANASGMNAAIGLVATTTGSFRVTGNLFYNCDGLRATSGLGAAFRSNVGADTAVLGYSLIAHNTFDNCGAATATTGVLQFTGAAAVKVHADHNIITTSTCKSVVSATKLASWTFGDTYATQQNYVALFAATASDTLHIAPDYVTTVLDSTRAFMPAACTVRVTSDASYMGYIVPKVATAVPVLVGPPNGTLTTEPCDEAQCVTVTWNKAAYADSYAVRAGATCGDGTFYYAGLGSGDTTAVVGPVTAKTAYFWQVRARDCDGWGAWTVCRTFGNSASTAASGPLWRDQFSRNFRLRGR